MNKDLYGIIQSYCDKHKQDFNVEYHKICKWNDNQNVLDINNGKFGNIANYRCFRIKYYYIFSIKSITGSIYSLPKNY